MNLINAAIDKGYDIKEFTDIVDKGSEPDENGDLYVPSKYAWATAGFWWNNNEMNQLIDTLADKTDIDAADAVTAVVNLNLGTDDYELRQKLYVKVKGILN